MSADVLPKPDDSSERKIFVAYPWNVYSSRVRYKRAYTNLEKALSIDFVFAEQRISDTHVLDKIIEMIEATDFGIYDVTGWNPNVTLEYGIARGMGARAFIAFNPDKTDLKDVPTDVRGYDRLQYADFDELSDVVATLVTQELGTGPRPPDPLDEDRRRLLSVIEAEPGKRALDIAESMNQRLDYVQLLLNRSRSELETTGKTRAVRYYPTGHAAAQEEAKSKGRTRKPRRPTKPRQTKRRKS